MNLIKNYSGWKVNQFVPWKRIFQIFFFPIFSAWGRQTDKSDQGTIANSSTGSLKKPLQYDPSSTVGIFHIIDLPSCHVKINTERHRNIIKLYDFWLHATMLTFIDSSYGYGAQYLYWTSGKRELFFGGNRSLDSSKSSGRYIDFGVELLLDFGGIIGWISSLDILLIE